MVDYTNQNYMTNRVIKEEVDKLQVWYEPPEEEGDEDTDKTILSSENNTYSVIINKANYDALLAETDSGLNRYYTRWPREDGIDAEGNPVHDLSTEVVGHSWESAMTAPTDPAETSSFPWIVLKLDDFTGSIEFKYDNVTKFTWNIEEARRYGIVSVPNDLGMTDYRLVWGTGATGTETFNPELLDVIFTPQE